MHVECFSRSAKTILFYYTNLQYIYFHMIYIVSLVTHAIKTKEEPT